MEPIILNFVHIKTYVNEMSNHLCINIFVYVYSMLKKFK